MVTLAPTEVIRLPAGAVRAAHTRITATGQPAMRGRLTAPAHPDRPAGAAGPSPAHLVRADGPDGTASAIWPVWSTTARVVVTDPDHLDEAVRIVAAHLRAVDAAASRFRVDSEIMGLDAAGGRPQVVSSLLAELVEVALAAAGRTGGDVDPTVGGPLADPGYDRDLSLLPAQAPPIRAVRRAAPGWRRVELRGRVLTVPVGVRLDLDATAKAHAADRAGRLVAERLDTGVLVSLGGDIATAGGAPTGGWLVRIADRPGEPASVIGLAAGAAVATSSAQGRRWRRGSRLLHHVLDPRTGQPARTVWRTVTVAAGSCVVANTASTAAIVRGLSAPGWLGGLGLAARLVDLDGEVMTVAGWPADPARAADRAAWSPAVAAGSQAAGARR